MPRTPLVLSLAAAAAALLARTGGAEASQTFPPQIQRSLKLDYQPPCFICHHPGNDPGKSTMDQKFGRMLRDEFGLRAGNTTLLDELLTSKKVAASDIDGDGVKDIDELEGHTSSGHPTNPSTDDPARIDVLQPAYGCFASAPGDSNTSSESSFSGRSSAPVFAAAATALGLALVARRRRR